MQKIRARESLSVGFDFKQCGEVTNELQNSAFALVADVCDFGYDGKRSAAVGVAFQETFHDVEHDSPALDAVFLTHECHVKRVEHRDVEANERTFAVHGAVVSGGCFHPLRVVIFHFDR